MALDLAEARARRARELEAIDRELREAFRVDALQRRANRIARILEALGDEEFKRYTELLLRFATSRARQRERQGNGQKIS